MIRRFTLVTGDRGEMTASLGSLVSSEGRGTRDTATRGERVSRRRRVDLDFSILEIEMMRHDRCRARASP